MRFNSFWSVAILTALTQTAIAVDDKAQRNNRSGRTAQVQPDAGEGHPGQQPVIEVKN
ncbi:MAG: hypothetical protein R3C59_27270 [Planctomycetaceae bacterium]